MVMSASFLNITYLELEDYLKDMVSSIIMMMMMNSIETVV